MPRSAGSYGPLGGTIRRLRQSRGWTQEQLALKAGAGVRTVRAIERDEYEPSDDMLRRLAGALEQTYEQLMAAGLQSIEIPLTQLIARLGELQRVSELLRKVDIRLITLTGPGGIGKTRLANEVARRFQDDMLHGVVFVKLDSIDDPALVDRSIAEALDIRLVPNKALFDQLRERLEGRHLLLVLDNFEHLLDAVPGVAKLIRMTSGFQVLVTSREPLGIQGERVVELQPLDVPSPAATQAAVAGDMADVGSAPAVVLFVQAAQRVLPEFSLTDDSADAVAELCRLADGNPLFLEQMAGNMYWLSPRELLEQRGDLRGLVRTELRDRHPRHESADSSFAWSYQRLRPFEQVLLRRLSVFVDGCSMDAIFSMCEGNSHPRSAVLTALRSLVYKSLLQKRTVDGQPRFFMHRLLREFARERLGEEEGEGDLTGQMHASYFLDLAEDADQYLRGPEEPHWLAVLERERSNLEAALHWLIRRNDPEQSLRLSVALARLWQVHGYWVAGVDFYDRVLALDTPDELTLWRAKALNNVGLLLQVQGANATARTRLEASLELSRRIGDTYRVGAASLNLGSVDENEGKLNAAEGHFTEALALFREARHRLGEASALGSLASLAHRRGKLPQAIAMHTESIKIFEEIQYAWGMANELSNLGNALLADLRGDEALGFLEQALEIRRRLGDVLGIADALQNIGIAYDQQGNYDAARVVLHENQELYRQLNDQDGLGGSLAAEGDVEQHDGNLEKARDLLNRSLKLRHEHGAPDTVVYSLEGLAGVAARAGDARRTAMLLGAADHIRQDLGQERTHDDQHVCDSLVEIALQTLDGKSFEHERSLGRGLSLDEAVTFALAEI